MEACAECGKEMDVVWVRPDALAKRIEDVQPRDLVCLADYLKAYWPEVG